MHPGRKYKDHVGSASNITIKNTVVIFPLYEWYGLSSRSSHTASGPW